METIASREAANMRVWAVLVGVASYSHMPTLRYTDDDAWRMYGFLKSPEGGAVDDERIRILDMWEQLLRRGYVQSNQINVQTGSLEFRCFYLIFG